MTLATRYVWRGLTRVDRPVVQPAAYLALERGPSFLTAGAWWNVEPSRAGATDLTLSGPGARGVGETNFWLEYARRTTVIDVRAGVWHYRLDEPRTTSGLPARFFTTELYGSAGSLHLPVAIRASGWFDVHRVDGAYYELEASHALGTQPLGQGVSSLVVGGRAGLSHGQSRPATEDEPFYFRRDGVTHFELFAQLSFELPFGPAPLVLGVEPHYDFARDPAARARGPDTGAGVRTRFFWLTASLSWRSRLTGSST